jgi:hypothetical protein
MAIAQKDWLEVRQNKSAMISMMIVPFIFIVFLPLLITLICRGVSGVESFVNDPDMQVFHYDA